MELQPVKAIDLDAGLIEGLAIPFDGPMQGRDLTGETFKTYTKLYLDWFPAGRPLLYQHGLDNDVKAVAVGRQMRATQQERGIWAEAQLDMAHEYAEQIKKLLKDGALYFSSGSMRHLVKAENGIITDWPWVELSLTPTPANPYAIVDVGKTASVFKSVGLHWPEDVLVKPEEPALGPVPELIGAFQMAEYRERHDKEFGGNV